MCSQISAYQIRHFPFPTPCTWASPEVEDPDLINIPHGMRVNQKAASLQPGIPESQRPKSKSKKPRALRLNYLKLISSFFFFFFQNSNWIACFYSSEEMCKWQREVISSMRNTFTWRQKTKKCNSLPICNHLSFLSNWYSNSLTPLSLRVINS